MQTTLTYLFDPLCGWCYGAGQVLPELAAVPGLSWTLLPTGLFAGEGARPMTEAFAGYAWGNDQRIAQLTGAVFSAAYRERVLKDTQRAFDSQLATVALTAVARTTPEHGLSALKAIQQARYVAAADITDRPTLVQVLNGLGLVDAAAQLDALEPDLLSATQQRMAQGHALMRAVRANGVPTFVLEKQGRRQVCSASDLFADPAAFARALL